MPTPADASVKRRISMVGTEIVAEGMLGIENAKRFSGLGRSALYDLMTRGDLPYAKVGARRLIPIAGLKALLARGLVGVPTEGEPPEKTPAPEPARQRRARS
jgi:hypothetical protein